MATATDLPTRDLDASPMLPAPVVPTDPRDRFFDIKAIEKDLGKRTVRGGAITLTAQGIKFVLRLGSTAILARLLTPADFGLIAMVAFVTGFAEMFKDAGLSMATVQRERITHAQVSSLFWVNVALSIVIMFVVAASSPLVAWLYGEPRLLAVTLALSGTMVFGGFSVQHQALLRRRMYYTRLAAIQVLSTLVGFVTAVCLAYSGYTYWALVGMTAAAAGSTALLSFMFSGWMPSYPRYVHGATSLLQYGGPIAGHQMVTYASRNCDNLLIGWWCGASALGLYSRAYALLLVPWAQFLAPVHAVVLPSLCRAVGSPDAFRKLYVRSLAVVAWPSFALITFLCLYATEVVQFVLGTQWEEVAGIFVCLAPAAAAISVRTSTTWAYASLGHVNRQLLFSVLQSIALLGAVIAGLAGGPAYVALGVSFVEVTFLLIGIDVCFRGTFLRWGDILRALALPLCSVAAALVGFAVVHLYRPYYAQMGGGVALVVSAIVVAPLHYIWLRKKA